MYFLLGAFMLQLRSAVTHVASWCPFTVETRVLSEAIPWEIYGGQSGTETAFSPHHFRFPVSFSFN